MVCDLALVQSCVSKCMAYLLQSAGEALPSVQLLICDLTLIQSCVRKCMAYLLQSAGEALPSAVDPESAVKMKWITIGKDMVVSALTVQRLCM